MTVLSKGSADMKQQRQAGSWPTALKAVLSAVIIAALPAVGAAAEYVVDVNDPQAADSNPGTADSPFKTIQKAATTAQPGDQVRIRPGRYAETVTLSGKPLNKPQGEVLGQRPKPITFFADAGGEVVLDGTVRVTAAELKPTETPGIYRWASPRKLEKISVNRPPLPAAWVFVGDDRLSIVHGRPIAAEDTWSFQREDDGVLINFDGKGIPDDARIEIACRADGFVVENRQGIEVKGLTFYRHSGDAVRFFGSQHCVVEDCDIIEPNLHGVHVMGQLIAVRRVRVANPNMWSMNIKGQAHLIEECVFQTSGSRSEPAADPWVGTLKFNGGSYYTIRHNVLLDRQPIERKVRGKSFPVVGGARAGIWGDVECYDNRIYGNAVARMGHAGIYVEWKQQRNTLMYNIVQDCAMGITVRQSSGSVIRRNWVFDSLALFGKPVDRDNFTGVTNRKPGQIGDHPMWGREDLDGLCLWHTFMDPPSQHNVIAENLVQVSGRSVSIPAPVVDDEQALKDAAEIMVTTADKVKKQGKVIAHLDQKTIKDSFGAPLNNYVNSNLYVFDPAKAQLGFALFLDKQLDGFDAYRQATGFDSDAKIGTFGPQDIGLNVLWTVPTGTLRPDRPIAMDYDGGAERPLPVGVAYFGRGIWLDGPILPYGWHRAAGASDDPGPPVSTAKNAKPDLRQWTQYPLSRNGARGLAVINPGDAAQVPADGLGWRSTSFPVSAGSMIDLSIHAKAQDVRPAGSEGVQVCLVFTDWTGHHRQRHWLVGEGTNSQLARGTYDWTPITARVPVPANATRVIVYAGLAPAAGTVVFDDLSLQIAAPGETAPNGKAEAN